jgi:hypothetical protein
MISSMVGGSRPLRGDDEFVRTIGTPQLLVRDATGNGRIAGVTLHELKINRDPRGTLTELLRLARSLQRRPPLRPGLYVDHIPRHGTR